MNAVPIMVGSVMLVGEKKKIHLGQFAIIVNMLSQKTAQDKHISLQMRAALSYPYTNVQYGNVITYDTCNNKIGEY